MDSSTIALLIRYFNTASTVIMSIFAFGGLVICGLIIALGKNSRLNAFRDKMFLSAFCVAALAALVLETVCFNYKHYLKYFAGEEFNITRNFSDSLELSDNSVSAELLAEKDSGKLIVGSVMFKDINRKVTSVLIQPTFDNIEQLDVRIRWTDEESTREMRKTLYKALPHENYTAIQPCGNVSELIIMFPKIPPLDEISQIVINRQIPFYFSGLRLFAISMIFFAIILLVYKPLRAKMAYYMFEYKFDPANRKQNLIYIGLVILTICFSGFCTYTSWGSVAVLSPVSDQYGKDLVDALIVGRTNLNFGHPEKLLNAERPYDWLWLLNSSYKRNVDWADDMSYYKGKYYAYFGIVPVVLLYLPYKFITRNHLSHFTGVFVLVTIAVVLLALFWRFLVRKYMSTARFAFYILSFFTLFFVSRLSTNIRYPQVYSIVQLAGFVFAIAGTFLLLKSVDKDKTNYMQLFFACLCLALTVGCRPNMILVSILVPAVLWKRRSWQLVMFTLIPYIMVAIPLCIYNYVRFDSIFEFGQKYCTMAWNGTTLHLLNPLGKIHRMFIVFISYLFRPYIYSCHFPFVELVPPGNLVVVAFGFVWARNGGGGLINYPILFCLFYLVKNIFSKNKPEGFGLSYIFFAIAIAMILLFSMIGTFHGRYLLDCALFYILPSLFCAYYWCNDGQHAVDQSVLRQKIIYVLFTVSIIIGLFLFVSGSDHVDLNYFDPALYRYLEYSLGIIERI